jgi:hypothetical protein
MDKDQMREGANTKYSVWQSESFLFSLDLNKVLLDGLKKAGLHVVEQTPGGKYCKLIIIINAKQIKRQNEISFLFFDGMCFILYHYCIFSIL